MLPSLRGQLTLREGAGQLPALLLDQGQPPGTRFLPTTKLRMCSLQRAVVQKAGEGVGDCPRPEKHTKKPRGMDYDPQSEWVGREHHMRRIIVVLAAMAAMVVVYAGAAWAASVSEVEPNDSIAEAQNIDGSSFSLDSDPNIGNTLINISPFVPHATINGTGNDTVDYYSFTVAQAGDVGVFDVDGAAVCNEAGCSSGFDSWIELLDGNDNYKLDVNDDSLTEWGQGGSGATTDSYLQYTFQTPGTYYVAVGSSAPVGSSDHLQPVPSGMSYQLQISLGVFPYTCFEKLPTIEAKPGQTVKGTKGDDVIAGTEGRDTINGGGGNDIICGKDGNDSINGGDGDDSISGGDGDDSISGGDGDDRIGNDAGYGDDTISGGAGNDYISDGEGNDRIKGDQGSDYLEGVFGDDTIDGGPGPDYIDGGPGHDWCSIGEIGRDSCEFGPSVTP